MWQSILFLRKLKNDKRKGKKKSKLKSKEKKNKVRHLIRLLLYIFLGLFIYILHFTIQYFRNFADFLFFKKVFYAIKRMPYLSIFNAKV